MQKDGILLHVGHRWMIHKANERFVICANIMNCQNNGFVLAILQIALHINIEMGIFTLHFDQLKLNVHFVYLFI